jgi:hypothetical protein
MQGPLPLDVGEDGRKVEALKFQETCENGMG